jgi:hypothetical protein
MKSRKIKTERIREFWRRFSAVAPRMAETPEDGGLISELDAMVRGLNPNLSWEMGPGLHRDWQFVISPNLDPDLATLSTEIVKYAPKLSGWEFHSARKPKQWEYKFELKTDKGRLEIDASKWTFVLLQYPDGLREVLLKGTGLPDLSDEQRWQAAAIALESEIGEEVLLHRIRSFDLVNDFGDPKFLEQERPIQQLRRAIGGDDD